ncbi:hypothetical protein FRB94_000213 [Tulasnella sp. JGI-2019a]|nr:hypothetical protein FRB94_000213 [Tulasnella sp. JGI-2019a]KAG9015329.1 hypothetical protein FRB93_013029 [Tulasnella sp. JGI-2019a]KAG9039366.1 hypothetical protein FRB95_010654 [Tulasnella sp. JGI-2019a]
MSSYLNGWLTTGWTGITPRTVAKPSAPPPPEIATIAPLDSSQDLDDGFEDDTPPAFPSLNSAQRSLGPTQFPSSQSGSKSAADAKLMPPPPPPLLRLNEGSAETSLALPDSTLKKPPNTNSKKKSRDKVALTPGHSMLDWANLKSSGQDLRVGVTTLLRVTPSELKQHRTRDDAWSAFGGKVYNMTPYLAFHPGGEKELMRVAGRDGTKLFAQTHSWVNIDFMLDGCMIGFLVPESRA